MPHTLHHNQIHLWRIDLTHDAPQVRLSPDEIARAQRLKLPAARDQFTRTRAHLRAILSAYVDQPADALRFAYSAHGKPTLLDHALHFNLAHSGTRALLAITRDTPVGVDIEQRRPIASLENLMAMSFTPTEQHAVTSTSDPLTAFFRVWTRKEAIVKCHGEGFKHMQAFSVSADDSPRVIASVDKTFDSLSLYEVIWDDYIAAIATKCKNCQVIIQNVGGV